MWRRHLNSDISVYSYPQNFQEVSDGTSIQEITNIINKWKVGMRMEEIYKEKAPVKNGACNLGRKKKRRNILYLEKLG